LHGALDGVAAPAHGHSYPAARSYGGISPARGPGAAGSGHGTSGSDWTALVRETPVTLPVGPVTAATAAVAAALPSGVLLLSPTELLVMSQQLWLLDLPASVASLFATKSLAANALASAALLLPERLRLQPAEVTRLTAKAAALSQMGFDLVLSNQVLIVRAVPQLLQGTPLSTVLPLWWEGWPAHAELTTLWQLLLQLLLSRQWLSAQLLLQSAADLLQYSEHWRAVPVDVSAARQQLLENNQ